MTLETLKEKGYQVSFSHNRTFELPSVGKFWGKRHDHPALKPLAKGGFTICTVKYDGHPVYSAVARCSNKDNYCKKTGRDIAFGRAVAELTGKAAIRRLRKEEEAGVSVGASFGGNYEYRNNGEVLPTVLSK